MTPAEKVMATREELLAEISRLEALLTVRELTTKGDEARIEELQERIAELEAQCRAQCELEIQHLKICVIACVMAAGELMPEQPLTSDYIYANDKIKQQFSKLHLALTAAENEKAELVKENDKLRGALIASIKTMQSAYRYIREGISGAD